MNYFSLTFHELLLPADALEAGVGSFGIRKVKVTMRRPSNDDQGHIRCRPRSHPVPLAQVSAS